MRNIFSLCAVCMVVFLSIIGCELKEEKAKEEKKACGYKVKRDDADPGFVLVMNKLRSLKKETLQELFSGKASKEETKEAMKVLNDALDKTTTLHVAVALYDVRSELKRMEGDDKGAEKDEAEAKRLTKCLTDNGKSLYKYNFGMNS